MCKGAKYLFAKRYIFFVLKMTHTDLGSNILAAVAARIDENQKRSCLDLQELIRSTHFTKQEIRCMYRGFKQVASGGIASSSDIL